MTEQIDFKALTEFAKLKMENPKEYEKVLKTIEDVLIDFSKIMVRVQEKIESELDD